MSDDPHSFDKTGVIRQLSAWYAAAGGARPLKALDALMREWLSGDCGRCAVETSTLTDHGDWLANAGFARAFRVGPTGADAIADFDALPIDTESLDLVIVCHVIEFADDPHRLLREIDRVLAPEGRCVIVTFNPFGLQGLVRPFKLFDGAPWCGRFYSLPRIRDWLSVLGFTVEKSCFLSPPFVVAGDRRWQRSADFMLTKGLFWMSSLTALYTCKRVSRPTPLREKWRIRSFLKSKVAQPTAFKPHDA